MTLLSKDKTFTWGKKSHYNMLLSYENILCLKIFFSGTEKGCFFAWSQGHAIHFNTKLEEGVKLLCKTNYGVIQFGFKSSSKNIS